MKFKFKEKEKLGLNFESRTGKFEQFSDDF
jgi:hypothetical protein